MSDRSVVGLFINPAHQSSMMPAKWYPPEEEYEYKKRFVEEDLTDLMQALDDKVLQCLYYMCCVMK